MCKEDFQASVFNLFLVFLNTRLMLSKKSATDLLVTAIRLINRDVETNLVLDVMDYGRLLLISKSLNLPITTDNFGMP